MAAVEEPVLKKAVKKRKDYLLENLGTLTMKQFRKLLEKDLDLPEKSLNAQKDLISELVDSLVKAHNEAEEAQPAKKKADKEPKKVEKKEKAGPKPAEKSKPPAATTGEKQHSKRFNKMKVVCRQAGIKVPPNIYTKNKTATQQEAALEALLEKHGLHWDSSPSEISAAQRRIAKEKDLEGIDMSNIVEGGRRSRARVDYSAVMKPSYEELSEDSAEEDGEDADDDSSSDTGDDGGSDEENVSPQNGSGSRKKTARQKRDEDDEEEEEEEEEASESQSDCGEAGDESLEGSSPIEAGKKRKTEVKEEPHSASKTGKSATPAKKVKTEVKEEPQSAGRAGKAASPARKASKSPGQPAKSPAGKPSTAKKSPPSGAKKQMVDSDDEEEEETGRLAKRRAVVDWSDDE